MSFPRLGTRCTRVWLHIFHNFVFFHGLCPRPPRGRPCLPPFGVWSLFGGFVLSVSTSTVSLDFSAPFMVMNSLCANSEDRDISTAFCRSSYGSYSSRSFSAGSSVENTILSLTMLSVSVNSHDKASVRSWVRNSSKVWPAVFEYSQNWYLENTIRFLPANSFSNFAFTSSNFVLSSPSLHSKWLYRFKASGPIADSNMVILVSSGFFVFSFATRYNSNLCNQRLQFSEGFPCSDRYSGSLKSCSMSASWSHYLTPCSIQQEQMCFREAIILIHVSKTWCDYLSNPARLHMWQLLWCSLRNTQKNFRAQTVFRGFDSTHLGTILLWNIFFSFCSVIYQLHLNFLALICN